MNMTWIAFYEELADVLLKYKDNRKELIKLLEKVFSDIDRELPTLELNKELIDIDPFTLFGTFNKGLSNDSRIRIITSVKNIFEIEKPVPTDFDGVPVLNNMNATFYDFVDKRKGDEIDNIWKLYELAIEYADKIKKEENKKSDDVYLSKEFCEYYTKVYKQKGVKDKLTIGLFWIRPDTYLNLDRVNTEFIIKEGIMKKSEINEKKIEGFSYVNMCHYIKSAIAYNSNYKTLPELSRIAWLKSMEDKELKNDGFWPSLKEYNPNISKEEWIKYFSEVEIPNHSLPIKMLVGMLKLGGETSCKQLSDVYGGSPKSYIGSTVSLGRRVKSYFNKPGCMDDGQERVFVYMFQGKRIGNNDKEYYVYKMRPEFKAALEELDLSDINPNYDIESEDKEMNKTGIDKNTILYGPPGTGKTYVTSEYAVAIVENKPLDLIQQEEHKEVYKRYLEYKEKGLIEFVTFHQSYGYEEFIEGIKPVIKGDDGGIGYTIEDGVFKSFCDSAKMPNNNIVDHNTKVWKIVLQTGNLVTSNTLKFDCFNEGKIAYDWKRKEEHTGTYSFNQITRFVENVNVGDVVVTYAGAGTNIDAIGIVTGDAEYDENKSSYRWSRAVDWLEINNVRNIKELNGDKYLDNDQLQHLKRVNVADLLKLVKPQLFTPNNKNYVFIIDEINRGNISKIFGELITLIETSKRLGKEEEMKATLPYSQDEFGVPDNVYILGTMNTADRSIALMDTALRRRFDFVEMMPNSDVLKGIKVDGLNISEMLDKINERIAYLYDREHTIGHAFFTRLRDNNDVDTLKSIFEKSVIPLLQEYFYEDYYKIQLVLGDNAKEDQYKFILDEKTAISNIFKGNVEEELDNQDVKYTINKPAFSKIESYKGII